jgi:guanylate kinase
MYERYSPERIFVYTGPDGSGRKSVAEAVGHTFGMNKVLSYVTRKPRPGEVDGQDYHFITKETYKEMEEQHEFIESVEIDGNYYGIRRVDVENELREHGCVYLILNHEGAQKMKDIYGDLVVRLFIYADRETVEARQKAMGLDPEVVAMHMRRYDEEMSYRHSCEHAFGNYDLADTVSRITGTLETYLQRGLVDKD